MKMPFLNKVSNQSIPEVLIFSQNQSSLSRIYEILSLKGFHKIKKIQEDPLKIQPEHIGSNIFGAVFETEFIQNTQDYIDLFSKLFIKKIPIVILAKNDSIKIYQEFLESGIVYLNTDTQIGQIYSRLIDFEENIQNRKSIKISILGTKGGVGNSFVSYHTARLIQERFLSWVINIQGSESSWNLDFISGKNFEREYVAPKELSLYIESKERNYDFHNPLHDKYNFVIFDHSVQSWQKENIELALNESDTVVITIGFEPDSLRKAKEILKINEFLLGVNQGVKKLFVCLNINTSKYKASFEKSDLEKILEVPINIVIPYQDIDRSLPATLPKGKTLKAFFELLDLLSGAMPKRKKKWF